MGEGGAGVRDAGKLVPAPFLVKTYRLVDDPSTDHIISWGENSNSFVVWRPKEFSAILLPTYFNHANFSSFVRQLNNYGFRKTIRGRCEFSNTLFEKGQQHLLCHIQRKKAFRPSPVLMEYGKPASLFPPMILPTQPSNVPVAPLPLLLPLPPSPSDLENDSSVLSEVTHLHDITFLVGHNNMKPPLIDMNASPGSSMTDVTEEISMSPQKLFGVLLY